MGHTKTKTRRSRPAKKSARPTSKAKIAPRARLLLPIFCEAWEVRAIRNKQKSQFRLALDPQPDLVTKDGIPIIYTQIQQIIDGKLVQKYGPDDDPDSRFCETLKPPYPKGTILWVREDFARHYHAGGLYPKETFVYQADYPNGMSDTHDFGLFEWQEGAEMPCSASRLALQITGHRLQLLHDITDEECIAEGMPAYNKPAPREQFFERYEAFNGPKSSEENVYVWAYDFVVYDLKNQGTKR